MNTKERAVTIRAKAKEYGFQIHAHGSIVSVSARFTPGDKEAYLRLEDHANEILGMFRMVSPGSVWGSDSGSVGGAIAIEKGQFVMNKSGCEKLLTRMFYVD
jgi:hypothetical protein